MSSPAFVPAAELSADLYSSVVRPLLGDRPHSAALLGWGSDVLGLDTVRSTDHGWGPRLLVFLDSPMAAAECRGPVTRGLPPEFRGWPTRFGWDGVPARDHVTVTTLSSWLLDFLGVDASAGMSTLDWLLTPQQRLLGVVAGPVFADDRGAVTAVRSSLRWYPDQLERWVLAAQWHRIAQEEAFVARTAEVGDETGSAVVGARLVRDLMRLALLLEQRYAPYSKWLGTAFARLPHADGLARQLADAVHAPDGARRESALAGAYRTVAARQNARGLTAPVGADVGDYHGRPAQVLMADRFSEALLATVTDPDLRALPLLGGIDQVVDSTDVLLDPARCRRLAALYGPLGS